MRQLLTLTGTDLRQRIRDRSVLILGVIVPLALMFVFNLVFGQDDQAEFEPVNVVLSAPADDALASALVGALTALQDGGFDVLVDEVPEGEAREQLETGDASIAVLVPEGAGAAAMAGRPLTVEAIRGDSAWLESEIALSVVDAVLDQFASGATTARAAQGVGLAPSQIGAIVDQAIADAPAYTLTQGVASSEQLSPGGALVAGQAGMFLLFTVSFGVMSLLVDRETGVLTRLRSLPLAPWKIVAAKALVSFLLGVVATSLLLAAGGRLFDADFGSLPSVAALVLAVCAAGTSVMFLIVRIARTSEQASIATTITAVVLGIGGGAFFPVSAAGPFADLLALNPVAALLQGLGITSSGGGIGDLGTPLAIMLGFTAVMLLLSRLVPDRGALR